MTSAEQVKRQIDQAMEHSDARVALFIRVTINNALNMLDEQRPAVLEALIEHGKDVQRSGNRPKHRDRLRAAVIEYLEERLHEARARERKLVEAITGVENPRND